jgi:hypothetical protein
VPTPQAGANLEKAKAEEPEANTSAGAEALQKATQNPVASRISVRVQNNRSCPMPSTHSVIEALLSGLSASVPRGRTIVRALAWPSLNHVDGITPRPGGHFLQNSVDMVADREF